MLREDKKYLAYFYIVSSLTTSHISLKKDVIDVKKLLKIFVSIDYKRHYYGILNISRKTIIHGIRINQHKNRMYIICIYFIIDI